MKKKLLIISAIIVVVSIGLFALWSINNAKNEKSLNEELSIVFDGTMEQTYPFIEKMAKALYVRVDILENNASYAHDYYPDDYKEAFRQLNIRSWDTELGVSCERWLRQYEMFYPSAVYGILEYGGSLRDSESRAFRKIMYAYNKPKGGLDADYDNFIDECRSVKISIIEGLRVLSKYKKDGVSIDSWKYIDSSQYSNIINRYYQRKNWPFKFFLKD